MPLPRPQRACCALLAASALATTKVDVGAIVGGGPINDGQLPWVAGVITTGSDSFQGQFCGATVVHPRWVLTAASCVAGMRTGGIEIGVGSRSLAGVQRIGVADIVIHPDFDPVSLEADLALILLEEPVPEGVPPLRLLDDPDLAAPGSFGRIAGWGATDTGGDSGSFPDILHAAVVPVVPNEVGNVPAIYNGRLTDRMLIAGYEAGGVGICYADTGGPMTVTDSLGVERLAGIASFGAPGAATCAAPEGYGGFTRVSSFRGWILSHTHPDYHAWEAGRLVVGEDRDPERDGKSNFLEFGGLGDPLGADSSAILSFKTTSVGGTDFPAVELVRRTDSNQVEYLIEFSSDLDDWQRIDLSSHITSSEPMGGRPGEIISVRAPVPIAELPDGRAFFRQRLLVSPAVSSVERTISAPGYAYSSLGNDDHTDLEGRPFKDFVIASDVKGGPWRVVARSSDFDIDLELLESDGESIARSTINNGGGSDEWIEYQPTPGPPARIRVRAGSPDGRGGFSLAIGQEVPDLPAADAGVTDGGLEKGDPLDQPALPLEFYLDQYLVRPADHERLFYAFLDSDQSKGGFDTYLRVRNGETGVLAAENDDIAPGNSNSFVVFPAEPRVPYVLDVTSFDELETGPYRVTLFPLRPISAGEIIPGQLEEGDAIDSLGAFYDSYYLPAPPAETTVTVSLRSDEIDPFLVHFDAGFNELGQDDDSGEGLSALIQFQADGVSSYIFDATSAFAGETGIYVIEVSFDGID